MHQSNQPKQTNKLFVVPFSEEQVGEPTKEEKAAFLSRMKTPGPVAQAKIKKIIALAALLKRKPLEPIPTVSQ